MTQRLAAAALISVFALLFVAPVVLGEDIGGQPVTSGAAPEAPALQSNGDAPSAPAAPAGEGEIVSDQPPAGPDGEPIEGEGPAKKPAFNPIILLVGVALLMFLFMGSGKKQEKKRKAMLANMKKGDRVTTIGGMVGSVLEVREKDVLLKIDEASNTRIRMARWAIRTIGTPEEEEEK